MSTLNNDIEKFRLFTRQMEMHRQQFFREDWEKNIKTLSRSQYFHLMMIRFLLPCNLNTIVAATGLTSAGASIYVDNLVQLNILKRELATHDRRNVVISLTERGEEELKKIDNRLNDFISRFLSDFTQEDWKIISHGIDLITPKLN